MTTAAPAPGGPRAWLFHPHTEPQWAAPHSALFLQAQGWALPPRPPASLVRGAPECSPMHYSVVLWFAHLLWTLSGLFYVL